MSGIGPVTGQPLHPEGYSGAASRPAPGTDPGTSPAPSAANRSEPVAPDPVEQEKGARQLAEELNASLQSVTGLHFRVDRELHKLVVTVVEKGSDTVIRQIPSEEMLELAKRIQDLEGLLLDKRA